MAAAQVLRNAFVPVVVWSVVFVFWMILSRHNHPTLVLNSIATFVLVGCSAVGAEFWKRAFVGRTFALRTIMRLAGIIALGAIAAVVIRLFYDMILGPDSRRFSFVANLLMDITFVAIHLFAAEVISRAWKRWP